MTTKNIISQIVLLVSQPQTSQITSSRNREGPDTVDPEEVT